MWLVGIWYMYVGKWVPNKSHAMGVAMNSTLGPTSRNRRTIYGS
jgi:hypothetical protein